MTFLKELGYTKPKFDGITYEYYSKFGLKDDIDWYWTYDVAVYLNYPYSDDIILMHDHPQTTPLFKPII